ncbi:uncharacterized protein EMH_0021080 [Eimeria mitis]|uniref:Uncharacterized protein n=1 Tax=Eimeria mitis TaxID=44415 RepID=U6KIG5_9EIME|nr:uncharacterized protein EMH_0021080 [Eimeria mitis]CDJ36586.1 hypothetical protein EMH_0021080 [Eimeria mitis]
MTRDFYIEPVHHKIILGMPWATQGKAQMHSPDDAIELFRPGSYESVHLSALSTTFASFTVGGMESMSHGKRCDESPMQCRGTEGNEGDMRAPRRDGLVKAAVLGVLIQSTPEERQKWAMLKEKFSVVLNNKEAAAGRPSARRAMHRIELVPRVLNQIKLRSR